MNHLYNQIVLIGDSITQWSFDPEIKGWGAKLSLTYVRKFDVYNRGFSGYNTEWAKIILKQLLPEHKSNNSDGPKIVLLTIFFGANDAALPISKQHVELDRYKQNLIEMVQMVKQSDSSIRIVLITPPPLDEEVWKVERNSETTKQYALTCAQVAEELCIPVVNLWKIITDSVNDKNSGLTLKDYLSDGLHLDSLGNEILHKSLLEIIVGNWPELDPEKLPMNVSPWNNLNLKNLDESLKFNDDFIYNQF
ncbi:hypothetical protein Glove_318g14 [Diversispora epigaea]|uniref:SGNH hydrolase-type esterase domain-containing protein n=1 Tax=Diversispora epigaea TaxID=1348612 RepID=A0A397HVP5_9GLOM|nr:hypothetical protein Glove_318g14 [Diversispora epigaea]